jgi:hypothetical protein
MFIENLRDLFVQIVTVWDSQSDDDVFSSYLFLQKQMYDHLGRLQVNYTGGTGL